MTIDDDKLMLLEQLTYLNSNVANAAGIGKSYVSIEDKTGSSVKNFLDQFSEEALTKLEKAGTILDSNGNSTYAQGKEWAAIIRALKNDDSVKDLKITDIDTNSSGKTAAICFTNKNEPDQAIVAFRGTLDGKEWVDNVEGLNATDTECQKEALEYIEGLPYGDITVVGHSKGGNKAQYVTICSDKVTKCVSMDGQGFSKEFIEKYWAEIQAKGELIKNYSLNNDYVHILLFPIPGADQLYCIGDGMETGLENHSPNSYFYIVDQDGKAVLKYNDGSIYINGTDKEYPSIAYLHGFVNFVLNVMPDENKEEVISYISTVLKISMSGDSIKIDGVTYNKDNILEFLQTDYETASLVAAYLVKYIDTYELTEDQIYDLLDAFGLGDIETDIKESGIKSWIVSDGSGGGVIRFLINQLKDGKNDHITTFILEWLISKWKKEKGIDFDLKKLWNMTEKKLGQIGSVDKETANKNATVKTGKTMSFSKETYECLMATIEAFESAVLGDVSSWSKYSAEEWYSSLGISAAIAGINLYSEKLSDINSTCKTRIETVFTNEWSIDNSAAGKTTGQTDSLNTVTNKYSALAERLAI